MKCLLSLKTYGGFMERILFNCYLKWTHEQNRDLFKRILKLPILAKILICTLISSLVAIIVMALFDTGFIIIPLTIEILACLVTYLYTDHYEIKYSEQELDSYREHCNDFKDMLLEMDFCISEAFCYDLKNRYVEKVDFNNKKVENNRITLGKWVKTLLVPVVLAVFGLLINPEAKYETALGVGMTIMFLFVISFLVAFIVIEIINLCIKSKNGEYQHLIDDLQGMIDFKMCSDSLQSFDEVIEA